MFLVGAILSALAPHAIARPFAAEIAPPAVRRVASVVVGLLLFELGGYAYHRLAHRVPALYRIHEVHHSSETLDWLAGFRQHPVEIWAMMLAQNLPLVLLGIPLADHAWILVWLKIHTVFVHANLRVPIGVLGELIATPRFHHRHHDRDRPPANYATLFPFFDRLFGTYDASVAEHAGLVEAMPTSFAGLLAHPATSLIRTRAPRREPASDRSPSRPS